MKGIRQTKKKKPNYHQRSQNLPPTTTQMTLNPPSRNRNQGAHTILLLDLKKINQMRIAKTAKPRKIGRIIQIRYRKLSSFSRASTDWRSPSMKDTRRPCSTVLMTNTILKATISRIPTETSSQKMKAWNPFISTLWSSKNTKSSNFPGFFQILNIWPSMRKMCWQRGWIWKISKTYRDFKSECAPQVNTLAA